MESKIGCGESFGDNINYYTTSSISSGSDLNAEIPRRYETTIKHTKDLLLLNKAALHLETSKLNEENGHCNNNPRSIFSRETEEMAMKQLEICDDEDSEEQDGNFDQEGNQMQIEAQEEAVEDNDLLFHSNAQNSTKSKQQPKPHLCYICGKDFELIALLRTHNVSDHNNLKPFKCSQCPKTFKFVHCLKGHEITHVYNYKMNEPAYKCKLCPKAYHSKPALRQHERAHQCGGYRCAECGAVLGYKSTLQQHLAAHEREKQTPSWKCDKCDKEYETQRKLISHRKMHNRTTDYQCEHCDRILRSRAYLIRHINAVHLKVNRHNCRKCGIGFFTKEDAKKHKLRVHFPEKWAALQEKRRNKKEGDGTKEKDEPNRALSALIFYDAHKI